jgi:outer membrane lipoprotein-sorting protein
LEDSGGQSRENFKRNLTEGATFRWGDVRMKTFGFLILIIFFLEGCVAAGYVVSGAGAAHTKYEAIELEKRVEQLEAVIATAHHMKECGSESSTQRYEGYVQAGLSE